MKVKEKVCVKLRQKDEINQFFLKYTEIKNILLTVKKNRE
jgi:hypothetical protein